MQPPRESHAHLFPTLPCPPLPSEPMEQDGVERLRPLVGERLKRLIH